MVIRKAIPGDAPELARLSLKLWPEHENEEMAREFEGLLANEDAALFLAVLAAIPTLMLRFTGTQVPFAASSMLIAVSVSLESMRTIKGEMAIRGIESDKDNGFM